MVMHDGLSERGVTRSLNSHKKHNCHIKDRQINHRTNSFTATVPRWEFQMLFGFLWSSHALGSFDMIAVTLQQPFGITFCTPKVENAHVTCGI